MTDTSTSTNSESLFITFLSPTRFYSNPVCSFLQYLQNKTSSSFQFINFPKNLYTASELLVKDYQPLTVLLQPPQGIQHPVVIVIPPTENDSVMLTLALSSVDVTRQLIGEEADNVSITWLIDILRTGTRMTRANCAFVSWEAQPNETIKARVDYGRLHLEKLPIILWTTAPLSEAISDLAVDTWKTEQQSDGAWLIVPQQLPKNRTPEEQYSLWIDASQTRYFLIPSSQELPCGNFSLHNLDGEQKEVAIVAIASCEITQEQAKLHLESEINQAIEQAKDAFFKTITVSIGKSPETSLPTTTTLSELMTVFLGASLEDLQNNPEMVKVGLENIVISFKEIIGGSLSQDSAQLNIARKQMNSWQASLKAHGIDLGNTLEKFPDRLNDLHFSPTSAASIHQMTANLRKFVDKINQISETKDWNFSEVLVAFANAYRELFGKEDEAQKQERLQQEYRKMADEAIAASLSHYPMPSLKFEDLLPNTTQKQDE